jgi:transglutaminase-like putative cysteine protease
VPDWLKAYARPKEGWVSYFLLFVMLLSLGWSVQSAGWLEHQDFLVPVALYGSLLGMLLALSPWRVIVTLPVGAMAGAAIVIWTVGSEYFSTASQIGRLFQLRAELLEWVKIVSQLGYPSALTPYAIGLAAIMWVTAFVAAYTLFRHHRAIDAILLVGAALIANMSATIVDLFGYLVLFVLAAMLLWLRSSLLVREEGWRRRRVNENVEVPSSIMRTGVVFIAVTIVMAWVLTSVAVAAPLTGAWRSLDTAWGGLRDTLDGVFGGLANDSSRLPGQSFSNHFIVRGDWTSSDIPVLTVAEDHAYYMQTVTLDVYTGHGWASTKGRDRNVDARAAIFPKGTPEEPATEDGFQKKTVTIQLREPVGRNLFVPGFPLAVSAPAIVTEPNGESFLGALNSKNPIQPGDAYSVTAVISEVTEAQLRSAGQKYPASVRGRYLSTDHVTARTRQLAQQIVTEAQAKTPYDKARALAHWLTTNRSLRYDTNVGTPPGDRDLVDFFLFESRRGYCQYFASAMAMMARSVGLPTRVATGYAPGSRMGDNLYEYREANAHAWAEVYFPGYGWQIFEATKSIDPQFVRSTGSTGPLASPVTGTEDDPGRAPFQAGIDDLDKGFTLPSARPIEGGTVAGVDSGQGGSTGDARSGGLFILLVIIVSAAAVIWWRLLRSGRRLRFLAPGDKQWALLLQAADRAGVSQRPSETDYEYAGWLEDQIPERRPEIRTIADAKVWGSYSGRGMTSDIIERMQRAWQRLRMPLVWLAVRRRARSLVPRRSR